MRLALVVLVLLLALAGTAEAATIRAAGPVEALATAGPEVAYADEHRRGCHEVRVWNVRTRSNVRYGNQCFEETSTGSGVAAVAVAGGRALWLSYTGGNIREWMLWTKSRTSKARQLRFVAREVDGPAPIVVGAPWGDALPYAVDDTAVVLGPSGLRRFTYDAGERITMLSAQARGFALVLESGAVVTLSRTGTFVARREVSKAAAAFWATPGLVVGTPTQLLVGSSSYALPASRLFGYASGTVAYGYGRQLRLFRVATERSTVFRTLPYRFPAAVGTYGLAYANGRTVVLVSL